MESQGAEKVTPAESGGRGRVVLPAAGPAGSEARTGAVPQVDLARALWCGLIPQTVCAAGILGLNVPAIMPFWSWDSPYNLPPALRASAWVQHPRTEWIAACAAILVGGLLAWMPYGKLRRAALLHGIGFGAVLFLAEWARESGVRLWTWRCQHTPRMQLDEREVLLAVGAVLLPGCVACLAGWLRRPASPEWRLGMAVALAHLCILVSVVLVAPEPRVFEDTGLFTPPLYWIGRPHAATVIAFTGAGLLAMLCRLAPTTDARSAVWCGLFLSWASLFVVGQRLEALSLFVSRFN